MPNFQFAECKKENWKSSTSTRQLRAWDALKLIHLKFGDIYENREYVFP